jgi:ketohexokinase
MHKVLSVGIATLDIINVVDHYPQEDEEMRALAQRLCRGGNAANTAVVLSQLDVESHWFGKLADDSNAQIISNDFQQFGVPHQHAAIQRSSSTPTSYITLNQSNGSRTIVHYRDLDELSLSDMQTISWQDYDWLHFEARNIANTQSILKFIRQQTDFNGHISLEIEKARDNELTLLEFADLVFFSKAYVCANGFDNCDQFVQAHAKRQTQDWVFPWGEEGAYAYPKEGGQFHQPAAEVARCVDSIGAGDTFVAASIAARLRNDTWQDTLQFANQTAAKKISQFGFQINN